jgi:capsular exopolysaccharide synthesis family protein
VLCATVANAHARAYIRQGIDLRSETNKAGLHFLEEKLVELKERVEKAEAALNHYRREKGIISLDDKENIIVDRLADLNTRLTDAEAERIGLEAQVQTLQQGNTALPALAENSLVQGLKQQLAKLEGDVAHLASQFKEDYPPLKQLRAQEEEIRRRLGQEVQGTADGILSAYQTAVRKENELRAKMDEQRVATLSLKDASVAYAVLAREVDTNRQLYDSVLQRIKEMGVATEMRTSNVSIIDQANVPRGPSSPNTRSHLLFGALLGLLGGVGLAFFFEYLDNTIKTPEQAERELGVPSLSVVPHFRSLQGGKGEEKSRIVQDARRQPMWWRRWGKQQIRGEESAETSNKQIVLAHHPLSVVSEAYRTLRAGILLSRAEEPPRSILFTSGVHAEGKTSTTLNTAIIFAQMKMRVLVIDADLRRPRCHQALRMKGGVGLSEVLTGQSKIEEAIQRTSVDNLHLLSSGAVPPNPAELIGSIKMHETLMTLRKQFDFIFIDSPPVMPVSDALLLAKMVDGVVMVIGGQETPKKVVKEARARLTYARVKILGTVLNKIELQRSGYYYHNYYYSSHYHRPEEAEGE